MEPVDDGDPLVRVTWHVPKSTLARLKEQSRLSGAPVAEVVRRALLQEASPALTILPPVTEAVPWVEGVMQGTDARPAVRVPTEDGAKLVDQGTGEVLAVERGRPKASSGGGGVQAGATRPKVQHHDDVVVGGGALVKCRRCTLVKNAGRPEVCDG